MCSPNSDMHCPLGIITPHSTRLLHSHVPISQFVQLCYHPVKFKIAICKSSVVFLTKPVESSQRAIVESDVQTHVRRWQFCIWIRHEQSRFQISVPRQWVSVCQIYTSFINQTGSRLLHQLRLLRMLHLLLLLRHHLHLHLRHPRHSAPPRC